MGCVLILNKVIAGCSLFLSFVYLLGCCWEFGSVIHRSSDSNISNFSEPENVMESSADESDDEGCNGSDYEFWTKFGKMTNRFKTIIIICLWVSIIGLLLQSLSSAFILFSSRGKTIGRSKYWVAVHFITFVILLFTLFVPYTHSRERDEFLSVGEFNSVMKKSFAGDAGDAAGWSGGGMSGFFHFMWCDLHLFYAMIFIDLCFLFGGMITVSCLLRFHETHEEAFYAEISSRYK